MTHEQSDQPLLDGFAPIEGVDIPVDVAKRAAVAAQMAERGQVRSYAQRTSEAFMDLGGGTSVVGSEELPKDIKPTPTTDVDHERWVVGRLGVSAPSSEYPDGVPRATEAQRAANSEAVAHLKSLIPPRTKRF